MWRGVQPVLQVLLPAVVLLGSCVTVFAETEPMSEVSAIPKFQPTDLAALQKVVGKINLRQADRASKQAFEAFFQQKTTMNEPVRMLEKATSIRHSTRTTGEHTLHGSRGELPPRHAPKAF
jgi:hypothetical protein